MGVGVGMVMTCLPASLSEWFACGLVADSHLLDYVSALKLQ